MSKKSLLAAQYNLMTTLSMTHIKQMYRNNLLLGRIALVFFSLILLLLCIRIILSPLIIYATTSWLEEQNINATIDDVRINIFDGSISLINAEGLQAGNSLFRVGLVDIHWDWSPLSNKAVQVTAVSLDKFNVSIEHYSDMIIIGGVVIPLTDTVTSDDEIKEKIEPEVQLWSASLGTVSFTNLNICYLQHQEILSNAKASNKFVDYCVSLKELAWHGTIDYAPTEALIANDDIPLRSTGDFTLNGLYIHDNKLDQFLLSSDSNVLKDVTIEGLNNISIKEVDMLALSGLERKDDKHQDAVRFEQIKIHDIHLKKLNSLSLGNITLNNPGLYLVKNESNIWEFQKWIPKDTRDKNTNQKDTLENQVTTAFNIKLNNITINNSDFCYLQQKNSLYYCLTADALTFLGATRYSTNKTSTNKPDLTMTADFSLDSLLIRNHTINRNLLAINTTNINQLHIDESLTVSFKKLSLKNLVALQKTKDNDDYTASFDLLAVTDLVSTNNSTSINTFKLDSLASNFSINKNGGWEHDKWLQQNRKKSKKPLPETDNNADKKPYLISLNKASIVTDNKNLFTDYSTTPTATAGLQNLNFVLNKLDAKKPDIASPFNLYAKTTRHSTIDIKGDIKPMAEKISFDAKGKLKGFDLRAASPSAEKAIGHIIKSGQLDADLQLKATEGILDSNIALSLYHFNIKPKSKKDEAELDKLFGIPLNQSLVLLKDKDESIHLDIPITGDVENPDFDPMHAIIKATSKATTVTLITFYTPYGLIYAGGNVLFDLATALDFEPVLFTAGSSDLKEDSKQQLKDLSKLLTEKPAVHLTLCGMTNYKDTTALFSITKDNNTPLSADRLNQLNELSKQRQIKVKEYLIKKLAIEHDRLILCAPEHETIEEAIAGVEVNI